MVGFLSWWRTEDYHIPGHLSLCRALLHLVYEFADGNRWSTLHLPVADAEATVVKFRSNGDLWLAAGSDLFLYSRSSPLWTYWRHEDPSTKNYVLDVLSTSDGTVWVASDAGVEIHELDGEVRFVEVIDGVSLNGVTGLAEDRDGNVWISSGSSFSGAYRWDGDRWRHFGAADGLAATRVHKIRVDRSGRLWFLGMAVLLTNVHFAELEEPGAFVYDGEGFVRWGVEEGLPSGRVYAFDEGPDSSLWFGTSGGLSRWKDGQWKHWFPQTRIFTLAVDAHNGVWFSDRENGLTYMDSLERMDSFDESDGLLSNTVMDLRVEDNGTLWAGTDRGVAIYRHGIWAGISTELGLGGSNVWPVLPLANRLIVGTSGAGVSVLDLEEARRLIPKVLLEEPFVDGDNALLRWNLYTYWGRVPQAGIETRYRLDDGDWSGWTNERELTASGLSTGGHVFELQAKGPLGDLARVEQAQFNIARPLFLKPVVLLPLVTLSLGLAGIIGQSLRTHRRDARKFRASEERYSIAERGSRDGLWDWNLSTDEIYYSARWKEQLGCEDDEIGSRVAEWFDRVHPEDRGRLEDAIAELLHGGESHFESEHRSRHNDNTYRWMVSRGTVVRDDAGKPYRMAGSQTDITSRKTMEAKHQHDALHDELTGLPNRALFMDRVTHARDRVSARGGRPFAVLFLDLDRFKVVNDSLGHGVGDGMLITVAERLLAAVRPGDTVGRFGGDEFVVLLEDLEDQSDAVRVVDRMHRDLAKPMLVSGHKMEITISVGVVLSLDAERDPDDLLRDADLAMYRAKANGGGRHEVFTSALRDRALQRLQTESALRRALDRGEFVLWYQPIVSLSDGSLEGVEALIRWEQDDGSLVMPGDFIPIAEETGLIIPIGVWVLQEACRQVREWQRSLPGAEGLRVNVNLSARQFGRKDLVGEVRRVLKRTGLSAQSLGLEVTETAVMDDGEATVEVLAELRSLGTRVQIDDFGTGYSSLRYLHRFPVDTLKIDRSFVSKIGPDPDSSAIVRSILSLAEQLGIGVVAEGIETEDQLNQLILLGCLVGQGNYMAPALNRADMEDRISQGWAALVH